MYYNHIPDSKTPAITIVVNTEIFLQGNQSDLNDKKNYFTSCTVFQIFYEVIIKYYQMFRSYKLIINFLKCIKI